MGDSVSLTLSASDPNGDPVTYSAAGLPPGLNVNLNSGVISGTLTTSGSYPVTASATDGDLSGSTTFSWTVDAALEPIAIASLNLAPQPINSTVSYTASATGTGPLEYRWTIADGTGVGNWSTNPTLNHSFSAPGRFLVTLEVRNAFESSSRTFTQAVHNPQTANSPQQTATLVVDNRLATDQLWVVNPDNDTVTVVDGPSLSKLAELPVGDNPVALALVGGNEVWVSNRYDATITRLSAASLSVIDTLSLPRGSAPFGLVADSVNNRVYVALEGLETVRTLDATTGATIAELAVGAHVRHLSLSGDGGELLATRFITPLQPGETGLNVSFSENGQPTGGEVLVLDTTANAVVSTIILEHSNAIVSEHSGPGLPNYLRSAVIAPDGLNAYVPGKQDNIATGAGRNGGLLDHDHTVRAISSGINLSSRTAALAGRVDHDNASVAAAAAYDASGNYLFVALEGNRMIAAVDAYRGEELFRFPRRSRTDGRQHGQRWHHPVRAQLHGSLGNRTRPIRAGEHR